MQSRSGSAHSNEARCRSNYVSSTLSSFPKLSYSLLASFRHAAAIPLLALLSIPLSALAQPSLLKTGTDPTPVTGLRNDSPELQRRRVVAVDAGVLNDLNSTAPGALLRLNLFGNVAPVISLDRQEKSGKGVFTWSGRVKGKPFTDFTMSVFGDAVAADLRLPGGKTFSIRSLGDGEHEVLEVDEKQQAPCGISGSETITKATDSDLHSRSTAVASETEVPVPDAAGEIDVLVAYTAQARAQAGGVDGMEALINLAIANANQTYANSQVPLTLVKVYTTETNHVEDPASMSTDLLRLKKTNDGYMDEVHQLRDAVGADMVMLMVSGTKSGTCGVAYLMSSGMKGSAFAANCFAVCANTCVNNQSFVHELGHNLGCAHDQANAGSPGAYPYAYGWRWNGTSAGTPEYRSIMAYAPGSRTKYFSNPDVRYDGTPTGTAMDSATPAYNARVITDTAGIVANFRSRVNGPQLIAKIGGSITTATLGQDAPTSSVILDMAGPGSVSYTIEANPGWLQVTGTTGTLSGAGAHNTHSLVFKTDRLPPGNYDTTITVSSIEASTTLTIPVKVVVDMNNDQFATAYPISAGGGTSIGGCTSEATREAGEPVTIGENDVAGQRSIWFRWVSPGDGVIAFDTTGSAFDTVLGAYTGSLGNLTPVAENDNMAGEAGKAYEEQSRVQFNATKDAVYYILVDSADGSSGHVVLNWSGTVPVTMSAFTIE